MKGGVLLPESSLAGCGPVRPRGYAQGNERNPARDGRLFVNWCVRQSEGVERLAPDVNPIHAFLPETLRAMRVLSMSSWQRPACFDAPPQLNCTPIGAGMELKSGEPAWE